MGSRRISSWPRMSLRPDWDSKPRSRWGLIVRLRLRATSTRRCPTQSLVVSCAFAAPRLDRRSSSRATRSETTTTGARTARNIKSERRGRYRCAMSAELDVPAAPHQLDLARARARDAGDLTRRHGVRSTPSAATSCPRCDRRPRSRRPCPRRPRRTPARPRTPSHPDHRLPPTAGPATTAFAAAACTFTWPRRAAPSPAWATPANDRRGRTRAQNLHRGLHRGCPPALLQQRECQVRKQANPGTYIARRLAIKQFSLDWPTSESTLPLQPRRAP